MHDADLAVLEHAAIEEASAVGEHDTPVVLTDDDREDHAARCYLRIRRLLGWLAALHHHFTCDAGHHE